MNWTAAKSSTLAWSAKLPGNFAREFILGIFDGDGFITYYQRESSPVSYVGFTGGSRQLLTKIVDVIEQETGVHLSGPWSRANSKVYVIRIGGRKAYLVDQWLRATGLGLARKRLVPPVG
jgi:hypothetical protein